MDKITITVNEQGENKVHEFVSVVGAKAFIKDCFDANPKSLSATEDSDATIVSIGNKEVAEYANSLLQ